MQEFKQMTTSDLVDMLAEQSARQSAILAEGGSLQELYTCKLTILFLQKEIESRKQGHPPFKEETIQ